ncbi:MAG: hypothetical protein ACXW3O_11340 [Brevundimonas sp.]
MLVTLLSALALLAPPQQTVQTAVDDPRLPTGPLVAMGPSPEGEVHVDAASWERSDIPGLVRGVGVIIRPPDVVPRVHVALIWIDCRNRTFQLSSGRLYDEAGQERGSSSWVRDRPIAADTAAARMEASFCPAPMTPAGQATVEDWRAALQRSGTGTGPAATSD